MTDSIDVLKGFLACRTVPAFLVGGCIRDSILGLATKDADVVVQGNTLSLGRELADILGAKFIILDEKRSVCRLLLPDRSGEYSFIDLASIKGSIDEDLASRDFTVDAMALPLGNYRTSTWRDYVIDPFDGQSDLGYRTIRAVSDHVFTEDPARLLRAPRLAGVLQFTIDAHTAELILKNSALIHQVSAERVRDEFLTVLALKGAKENLRSLDELGLLCHIIPELGTTRGVEQPSEHYWDVFEHSIQTVGEIEKLTQIHGKDQLASMVTWDDSLEVYFGRTISDGHTRCTLLKLGALLHDIAKPQTKAMDANGRTRFLGHSTLGASMARFRLNALRLSARGVLGVSNMIEYHLRPSQMIQGTDKPTQRAIYRYFRDLKESATEVLYLSLADYAAARGPLMEIEDWRHRVSMINYVIEEGNRDRTSERPPRLVTGHDLMGFLNIEPGPRLGNLLGRILEAQVLGELSTRDEALIWARARLIEGEG